jgi:hypothetical protein
MNANKATAFEHLDFLHPLINLATIQSLLFIYCFLDFELQHSVQRPTRNTLLSSH